MADRPPDYWRKFKVTPEWLKEQHDALTDERAEQFAQLRGFPTVSAMKRAIPGLGWFAELNRWVLPLWTVDDQVYAAKAWRPTGTRWITIGWDHAKQAEAQQHPAGRLFGMNHVVNHINDARGGSWLWITAGEFDAIMLRCFGWLTTTLTQGEASKPSAEMLLRELGGRKAMEAITTILRGFVVVFDVDDAGRNGAVWVVDALERVISDNNIGITDRWEGVKAVDLRQLPGWEQSEQPEGWDVSDMVRWAHRNDIKVAALLREFADTVVAGSEAAAELLGTHDVSSTPSLDTVFVPTMHTTELDDLLAFAVSYAKQIGSRGEGAYHLGLRASRTGWTLVELQAEKAAEQYKQRVDAQIIKGDVKPLSDYEYELSRSFLNPGMVENLTDDLANVKRLAHYFPFMKYQPKRRRWLWWSGKYWLDDETKINEHAGRVSDYIGEEAVQAMANGDHILGGRLRKWAHTSRSKPRLDAIKALAAGDPLFRPVAEYGERWDGNGMVIGTPIGVFDLEHGKLLGSVEGRNCWCSMTTRGSVLMDTAGFDRWGQRWEAGWQLWRRTLKQWHEDEEITMLLQDIFGMALRGQLVERIYYLYGSGRSGKSACLDAVGHAMGDYAYEIMGSALTKGKEDNTRGSSIALSYGKRFVKVTETGTKLLDTDVLKTLTGETQLVGRALYSDVGTGENTGSYFLMSNNEPDLGGDVSEALRNRLVVIPWERTFVDRQLLSDPEYVSGVVDGSVLPREDSLKYQLMGAAGWEQMPDVILTWMYGGLQRVMGRSGIHGSSLVLPESIVERTNVVWSESDMVTMFFSECGMFEPGGQSEIAAQGLWQRMKEWAKINAPDFDADLGDNPRYLGQMLRHRAGRGYYSKKSTQAIWKGDRRQVNAWVVPWTFKG
jgi:hypothetical protein